MLTLALAYNDFKSVEWATLNVVGATERRTHRPDAIRGQALGIFIWSRRMLHGLVHELLAAIAKAKAAGTLEHPRWVRAVSATSGETQELWDVLSEVAMPTGTADDADVIDSLRAMLAMVRNNGTFHYGQGKVLKPAYDVHFGAKQRSTEFGPDATASIAEALEGTRFYFADAMVHAYYKERFGEEQTLHFTDFKVMCERGLRELLAAYLDLRQNELGAPSQGALNAATDPWLE